MKDLVRLQPELKKRKLTTKQTKLNNFQLGDVGEVLACRYLESKDYKILERNSRINNNELDIIALDVNNSELVFIEVKTRSTAQFGSPDSAVTQKKLHSMMRVAKHYMRANHCKLDFRFDIISICFLSSKQKNARPQIEHFENITWL